jgi:hypothetical protein
MKPTQYQKIEADVDDAIDALIKRMQRKYKLSWAKARDQVNRAIYILSSSSPKELKKRQKEMKFK